MRKTIKQLEQEIERLEEDKLHWYNKFNELKKKEDERTRCEISGLMDEKENLLNQTRTLLEIIRWQINPNTTNSPFMPAKDQREDNKRSY